MWVFSCQYFLNKKTILFRYLNARHWRILETTTYNQPASERETERKEKSQDLVQYLVWMCNNFKAFKSWKKKFWVYFLSNWTIRMSSSTKNLTSLQFLFYPELCKESHLLRCLLFLCKSFIIDCYNSFYKGNVVISCLNFQCLINYFQRWIKSLKSFCSGFPSLKSPLAGGGQTTR